MDFRLTLVVKFSEHWDCNLNPFQIYQRFWSKLSLSMIWTKSISSKKLKKNLKDYLFSFVQQSLMHVVNGVFFVVTHWQVKVKGFWMLLNKEADKTLSHPLLVMNAKLSFFTEAKYTQCHRIIHWFMGLCQYILVLVSYVL